MLRQRQRRISDPKYLKWIRAQPCCICGTINSEAAHIRMSSIEYGKRETGMAEKADDYWTTPLCNLHHREQHAMSEASFWGRHNKNPFRLARILKHDYDSENTA